MRVRAPLVLLLVLASFGCTSATETATSPAQCLEDCAVDVPDAGADADHEVDAATNNDVDRRVSYHRDVRPILQEQCVACHTEGGIGPWALDSYEAVQPIAALVLSAVETGKMPPWLPAEGCGEFKDKRTPTVEQIATLRTWVEEGTYEGDPDDYVAPPGRTVADLGEPDFVYDIGTDYVPSPRGDDVDDYHCFVVDPGFTEDKFVNAIETVPGNLATVHHMLLYAVPKTRMSRIQQLENEDPSTPGYTCFGGTRTGGSLQESEFLGLIAGWVPGTTPVIYDEGMGIRLKADTVLIAQIHYNTVNSTAPDRTKVNLHFVEGQPTTRLQMLPLPATELDIAAGDADGVERFTLDYPLPNITIYGVVPHMHTLGTSIRVWTERSGEETCLVDIPDWDFNWQGFYFYEEPVDVRAGSRVTIECHYDNTAANQREGNSPKRVRWGDGTDDEMCLNYFIIKEVFVP